jgi:hypothetical protein
MRSREVIFIVITAVVMEVLASFDTPINMATKNWLGGENLADDNTPLDRKSLRPPESPIPPLTPLLPV